MVPEREAEGALLRRLAETDRALAAARAGFEETADADLMEYYLYQVSALRARHSYLLGQMRKEGGREWIGYPARGAGP